MSDRTRVLNKVPDPRQSVRIWSVAWGLALMIVALLHRRRLRLRAAPATANFASLLSARTRMTANFRLPGPGACGLPKATTSNSFR